MKQHQVQTNGVSLNVVEDGDGPAVLFVHGFPDGWRGWRRQMAAVVGSGHRAVALDMRGYGGSSKPGDPRLYTIFHCVGDLVGVLDALDVEQATLAGHDFGAAIGWSAAFMRPERFPAVFCLSVPPMIPGGPSMLDQMEAAGHAEKFYMFRQMCPEAEAEWAAAAVTIPGVLYWTSGLPSLADAWDPMDPSKGLTRPSPVGIPAFADRGDVAAAIGGFERDGFQGPLNYYRAIQPYFDMAGAFKGARIAQPSFFAFGTKDGMVRMRDPKRAELEVVATDLRGFLPIEGVGHWPQLEATSIVNHALISFLDEVTAP